MGWLHCLLRGKESGRRATPGRTFWTSGTAEPKAWRNERVKNVPGHWSHIAGIDRRELRGMLTGA